MPDSRGQGGGRPRWVVVGALLLAAVLVGVLLLVFPPGGSGGEGPPRALYYDSLSREYPNETLREYVVGRLRSAGYVVDVYVGANATLEPLEMLEEYDLVILRAHGAYNGDPETGRPLGAYIYTGLHYEEAVSQYGKKTVDTMIDRGLLALAVIPPPLWNGSLEGLPRYVAVSPAFIEARLGGMEGSIVVFSGCYGMNDHRLARVFTGHGATAYISWRGDVSWTRADEALKAIVDQILAGTPPESLPEALGPLARDPFTGATLEVYTGG